jgi:hypothetical protein
MPLTPILLAACLLGTLVVLAEPMAAANQCGDANVQVNCTLANGENCTLWVTACQFATILNDLSGVMHG